MAWKLQNANIKLPQWNWSYIIWTNHLAWNLLSICVTLYLFGPPNHYGHKQKKPFFWVVHSPPRRYSLINCCLNHCYTLHFICFNHSATSVVVQWDVNYSFSLQTVKSLFYILIGQKLWNYPSFWMRRALITNLCMVFFPLVKGSVCMLVPPKARNRPTAWNSKYAHTNDLWTTHAQ